MEASKASEVGDGGWIGNEIELLIQLNNFH